MKQFFKFMFASMAAMLFTTVLVILLFVGIITAMVASASGSNEKTTFVPKNSILHIKLNEEIKDRASGNPFENIDFNTFESKEAPSLTQILNNIKKAKTDDRIKGIYLDLSTINAGTATIEEIRNSLNEFKTSGKWIISYSETYTQGSYYLASVSDKIFLNPAGMMELKGLASQIAFFKGALEKLDVDVQIIRHGKFKSAVEPFMLDKMSDSNREQMEKILNSMWGSMLNKIAGSRKIEVAEINRLTDKILVRTPEDAVKYGFVDKLMYKDQILIELRDRLDLGENGDIKTTSLAKYTNAKGSKDVSKKKESKNKIAIVYASGDIVSGNSDDGKMGSETISKAIREARLDSNVKAIVLRVNSPGGSAMASDVMWREVVLSKKAKPVIVSMGDVAASGGYYIACAADKIIASEKTITGSIGVFGIIPNAQGFFNNKLGVTFDTVKTNTHADIMTILRPLTAEEKAIIQHGVEDIYDDFITKVADGRGMTKEEVDAIGQGRVWTGADAKEIGLVDEFGGLEKAIKIAKDMAKLEDYDLENYPKQKDPVAQLMLDLSSSAKASIWEAYLGPDYKYYNKIKDLSTQKGIMTRMAFDVEIY